MTKLKVGIFSALVIAGVAIPLVIHHQTRTRLREKDEFLQQQADQLARLKAANEHLSGLVADNSPAADQVNELQRLRREAGALRAQTNGLATLEAEHRRLQAAVAPRIAWQTKEETKAKTAFSRECLMALRFYADDNNDQLPAEFEAVSRFLPVKTGTKTNLTTGLFEIVCQGPLSKIKNPEKTIVIQLRAKDESLRQQMEEMTPLQAESERLSNQIAQAKSAPSLSTEQFRELQRLRGEIGGLKRAGMEEKGQLQATNALFRAALEESERELAALRAAPNFWAKEQLGFAGYATPESAMKTVLWSMTSGDIASFLDCCTPEVRAVLGKHLTGKPEEEVAAEAKEMHESLSPTIGFRVLDQKAASASEMVVNVSFDGAGKARKFTLRRIGDEWKIHQMGEEYSAR